jgi:hypothetical protein
MCNIDRRAETQLLAMGLNLITKAIEASVRENNQIQSSDVLATATTAYQQGKITKHQLMAVINALDEQAYQTKPYAEPVHPYRAWLAKQ